MIQIPNDFRENLWDINPHLIYLKPFSKLYTSGKPEDTSKILWCIVWFSHPDEEENRYYRLPDDEKLEVCREFCPEFDLNNDLVSECIEKFPELLLDAAAHAYKESKDQLLKITRFLNTQEITFDTAELIIKLKAQLPKIFQDFEKVEKAFLKSKNEQRVHGGRAKTQRERNVFQPDK